MYINRKIETRLLQNLERNEVMVLVGPRQAGKTTMKINREGIYNAVISAKTREEKDSLTSYLATKAFTMR